MVMIKKNSKEMGEDFRKDYKELIKERVTIRVNSHFSLIETTNKFDNDFINEVTEDIYLKTKNVLQAYIDLKVSAVFRKFDEYKNINQKLHGDKPLKRVNDEIYEYIQEDW